MESPKTCILTINGGSSSIKFALYEIHNESLKRLFYGEMESISKENTKLHVTDTVTQQKNSVNIKATNIDDAIIFLFNWFKQQKVFDSVRAIGHRIVYGMQHTEPEKITPRLLDELKAISAYDPEHMPMAIKLIEACQKHYPEHMQIACFDTAFHTSMPQVAKMLSLPRRYYAAGIQRYGFHGLSYAYLIEELNRLAGRETAKDKVILAHLGNGASLAAVMEGKSVDTTMGFTPTSGITMGTRSGDLDPGIAWYLMAIEKLNPEQFSHLINHESGLLGVSETSSDMRELLECQNTDSRAAEAIELFCYQAKKWVGAFAAVLGGLNTLVFSGGIGENNAQIRARICSGLQFLGLELDESKNANSETIISSDQSKVSVRVIKTNEELMIARLVCHVLNYSYKN